MRCASRTATGPWIFCVKLGRVEYPFRQYVSGGSYQEIKNAILYDDVEKFVELVERKLWKPLDNSHSKYCPPELLVWICDCCAVDCAAALLNGKTGLTVDLNVPLKSGMFPLHYAALSLSPGLTKLFLESGAQANVRCNDVELVFYGLLPLNIALEVLHKVIWWSPEQSIFGLVIALCQDEMKDPLETIKLLGINTTGLLDVTYHHAKEGNLVQLAALLTVEPPMLDKFGDESEDDCSLDGSMKLRQCIANEIASLIDVECILRGRGSSKLVQMCNKKKKVMMSVMLLLEFFWRGGCHLTEFFRLCSYQMIQISIQRVDLNQKTSACHRTCNHTVLL
uniref:Uncharacterized protein n=1 Tax=Davidia involucrata TaxID=16924 RepID=A0A5B6ZXN6_DAVIN